MPTDNVWRMAEWILARGTRFHAFDAEDYVKFLSIICEEEGRRLFSPFSSRKRIMFDLKLKSVVR